MEQDRKEKAPVPAEGWALAARENDKAAVRNAEGDKAVDAAQDKAAVVGAGGEIGCVPRRLPARRR